MFFSPPCPSASSPTPGVIVLAFVLCWLPFHVGRTIFSLSFGTSSDSQETYTDTNSHVDVNTLSDISIDRNINTHTGTKPISHSDLDMQFKTHSETGKMTAHAHTERDEDFCHICAKAQIKINTHTDADIHLADTKAKTHSDVGIQSDNMSTNKQTHNDTVHVDTQLATHKMTPVITQVSHSHTSFNTNVHANRPSSTVRNRTLICINHTPIKKDCTPPTARTDTYAVTPTDLYNDTRFNNMYPHPDTHFLYYLSQYFNLVSSVLFYLSAAINPLLYNLMSARYRHAVHSLIHTHSHTQSNRLRTLTGRHSTTTL